jgi:Fe2+ or Zn2+ uptake regulation protein
MSIPKKTLLTNATWLRYYSRVYIIAEYMSLNELLAKVRSRGGRLTKTRIAILSGFLMATRPLSPLEIISYLELNFLLENNLIREVRLLEGKAALYELSNEHRHHLICLKCRQIQSLPMDHQLCQQEKIINQQNNFKVLDHSLEFYGLCKNCQ